MNEKILKAQSKIMDKIHELEVEFDKNSKEWDAMSMGKNVAERQGLLDAFFILTHISRE